MALNVTRGFGGNGQAFRKISLPFDGSSSPRQGKFYLVNHDPDEGHKPETRQSNKVVLPATGVAGVSVRLQYFIWSTCKLEAGEVAPETSMLFIK